MLILFIVLLAVWLVLGAVGFVIKGVFGVALFVILFVVLIGALAAIRKRYVRRKQERATNSHK